MLIIGHNLFSGVEVRHDEGDGGESASASVFAEHLQLPQTRRELGVASVVEEGGIQGLVVVETPVVSGLIQLLVERIDFEASVRKNVVTGAI